MKRRVAPRFGLCRPIILSDVSVNARGYERLSEQMSGVVAHG